MDSSPPRQGPTGEWTSPKRKVVRSRCRKDNISAAKVSRLELVPVSTVKDMLKQETCHRPGRNRSGRPPLVNERTVRQLIRAIRASVDGRFSSYGKLAKEMGIKAHRTTIKRALNNAGYYKCAACPKPFINEQNRKKRLAFAHEHVNKPIEFWKRVIWTDESSFDTSMRGKRWVTRQAHERLCPDCTLKTFSSGRTSVMVWGGIWHDAGTNLVWLKGTPKKAGGRSTIASSDYIDQVLEPHLEPAYRGLKELGLEPLLMEDGASIHTSKEATAWRQSAGITQLEWPPSSPDLNPDENMWGAMKQRIKHGPVLYTKQADMFMAAEREWNRLLEEGHHQKWVEEMKKRLEEVIARKGYATSF